VTASPERRSPLDGWSDRFSTASSAVDRFAIREVPFLAQIGLRGDANDAEFRARTKEALGFTLAPANNWSKSSARHALWLGPDEWLIVAEGEAPELLEQALRDRLRGLHHSVVDLSANYTTIEITGMDARLVLAKGMPLDLHAAAFKTPAAAQSLLAKAQVILQCLDDGPTFRIYVRPSFAGYLAEWLLDAAAECAASRALDGNRLTARLR
jgi:sarcosine oxidase, subunit gamma